MEGELRLMEAVPDRRAALGDKELDNRANADQVAVWSQLELGDAYQLQLDQLRQLAV